MNITINGTEYTYSSRIKALKVLTWWTIFRIRMFFKFSLKIKFNRLFVLPYYRFRVNQSRKKIERIDRKIESNNRKLAKLYGEDSE